MYHLVRTRSQHFVNSPRRSATPLKHKYAVNNVRHPLKRRRIGSTAFAPSRAINISDNEDTDEEFPVDEVAKRKARTALSAEIGQQTVNRGRKRRDGQSRLEGDGNKFIGRVFIDLSGLSDGESSPRKRKRSDRDDNSVAGSGSWVEMEEDEEEPDFIAESGSHFPPHWKC